MRASAQQHLRRFRQATLLSVALTGLLLIVIPGADAAQEEAPDTAEVAQEDVQEDFEEVGALRADSLAREAVVEAEHVFRGLWRGFVRSLPKVAVVLLILALAGY